MYVCSDLWLMERSCSSSWIHQPRTAVQAFVDLHNPRVTQRLLGFHSQIVALNCDLYYCQLVFVFIWWFWELLRLNREYFLDTELSTAEQVAPLCSSDVMLCEQLNSKIAWHIMLVVNEWNVWSIGGMVLTGTNDVAERKTCPKCTLSITVPTWTVLKSNLDVHNWLPEP